MASVRIEFSDGEARALFVAAKTLADSDEMDDWTHTDKQRLYRALRKVELSLEFYTPSGPVLLPADIIDQP